MYAIVDIETTGGSHKHEKITEIAIFVHDGETIVDEFCTLINPERPIPYFITGLTGITNEMVADAPKFYEVARRIVEITEGCVFVAHNVNFDYHFVREEFDRLGFDYKRSTLCTVKTSRKLIPGKRSYSLGNLCDDLGIHVQDRHRASGDALATVKLFELLLSVNGGSFKDDKKRSEASLKNMHIAFDASLIDRLPHKTGVYHFVDERGKIIYIGKSKDIHNRVLSHFSSVTTRKAIEMKSKIVDIGFDITGSELLALLYESYLIKKHQPLYNRAQRRAGNHFGIYSYMDGNGYLRFQLGKNAGNSAIPVTSFHSMAEAREFLNLMVAEYQLCQKLCGIYKSDDACFHYQIGGCKGACISEESPEHYNLRAQQVIRRFEYVHQNFWILDEGRSAEEHSIVRIRNGKYIGFGFVDKHNDYGSVEFLDDCIKSYPDNREVQQIISSYLRIHKNVKVIYDP